jgi:hypothetical protein
MLIESYLVDLDMKISVSVLSYLLAALIDKPIWSTSPDDTRVHSANH